MTTTDPTPTLQPDPDLDLDRAMGDAARREAPVTVFRIVAAAADPDAFTVEPIYPGAQTTERVPAPVPALRAALLLARHATTTARRQVRRAREAGLSWADIAPVLDAEDGQAAYEWATGGVEDHWRRSSVTYRCPSCAELIADYGPYENHPDDCESGHTPGCARHLTALLTWSATNDEDPASDYPDDDDHPDGVELTGLPGAGV